MHKSKQLALLTHPCIFLLHKNSFSEKLCVLTRNHAAPVVTLFSSLTHVICMALHHTVVIRYSTSVSYRTLCNASGHLVIYRECYGFERSFFTLKHFFTLHFFLLFQDFPRAGSSTSKLTVLHPDLQNIALARLFV